MLMGHFLQKCCVALSNTYNLKNIQHSVSASLIQPGSCFHSSTVQSEQIKNGRPMPIVYYYQNPFHWLKIKWQLLKLKKWDRDFNESEFRRGSTYAISSVTKIVSGQNLDDLEGLLTPFALSKLRRDILVLWNDEIVRNIGLRLSDIKLAVPTKVHIRRNYPLPKRICDIDMWYMAMKWRDMDALLVIDLVARFNKDFTNEQHNSDWTISFFELRKYYVQNYKTENK